MINLSTSIYIHTSLLHCDHHHGTLYLPIFHLSIITYVVNMMNLSCSCVLQRKLSMEA